MDNKLPEGILQSDLKWSYDKNDPSHYFFQNLNSFTMYYTLRFGWVITTLFISRGKNGFADRTYGISVKDRTVVTVGRGPHVLQEITVYVKESRKDALKKYTDLYVEGLGKASEVRDSISTHRAMGALRRAKRGWL